MAERIDVNFKLPKHGETLILTVPKSKNYGTTVDATHEKKAKW